MYGRFWKDLSRLEFRKVEIESERIYQHSGIRTPPPKLLKHYFLLASQLSRLYMLPTVISNGALRFKLETVFNEDITGKTGRMPFT